MLLSAWGFYLAFLRYVLAGLMLALVVVTSLNVISRYGGFGTFSWADETARRTLLWMAFFGAALAVSNQSHLRIDTIVMRLSESSKRLLEATTSVILFGFAAFLVWGGSRFTLINLGQRTPGMSVSFAWSYSATPVGGLLMAVSLLGRLVFGRGEPERSTVAGGLSTTLPLADDDEKG